jgi:hypothetical protein
MRRLLTDLLAGPRRAAEEWITMSATKAAWCAFATIFGALLCASALLVTACGGQIGAGASPDDAGASVSVDAGATVPRDGSAGVDAGPGPDATVGDADAPQTARPA